MQSLMMQESYRIYLDCLLYRNFIQRESLFTLGALRGLLIRYHQQASTQRARLGEG